MSLAHAAAISRPWKASPAPIGTGLCIKPYSSSIAVRATQMALRRFLVCPAGPVRCMPKALPRLFRTTERIRAAFSIAALASAFSACSFTRASRAVCCLSASCFAASACSAALACSLASSSACCWSKRVWAFCFAFSRLAAAIGFGGAGVPATAEVADDAAAPTASAPTAGVTLGVGA